MTAAYNSPEMCALGDCALLVTFSVRISDKDNARAHSLSSALQERSIPGVLDLVPGFSSLLVRFDPAVLSEEQLRQEINLAGRANAEERKVPATAHVIPVAYGGDNGPDLDRVAALKGLTTSEVARLHSSVAYRVYFVGFMPGFAYMGTVPANIAAPRLPAPRVRLPAGSVGIAGEQTGIYPLAGPGGWNIVGQTSVRPWDLGRARPSLFAPGDSVRFVGDPAAGTEKVALRQANHVPTNPPVLQVRDASGVTTVQDQGRPGHGSQGVPQGGAMDPFAAARANALVGNPVDQAVLELTWKGPGLRVLGPSAFAIEGDDLGCRVGSYRVPPGISWLLREGDEIDFDGRLAGAGTRAYLSVAGGLDVPEVLGSRSTYLPAMFGGVDGRALSTGDLLHSAPPRRPLVDLVGRYWPGRGGPLLKGQAGAIAFVPYLGPGSAGADAVKQFARSSWVVEPESDRMGLRVRHAGGETIRGTGGEVVSFGMVRGAIQLPPRGSPVILAADHGTTGGYPLLGAVATAEWGRISSLAPGDEIRFEPISTEDARARIAAERISLERGLRLLLI